MSWAAASLVARSFGKLVGLALFVGLFISRAHAAGAQAQVTHVRKDVKILPAKGAPHAARLRENLSDGATVRTGADSQSEVVFPDRTLARLAAQTVFDFTDGTNAMDLQKGAMLVRAPRSARGAEIRAAGATVDVAGTTCLLEHNAGRYVKLVVLEGTARMFLKTIVGESVLVKEGQLLMFHLGPKLSSLPNPVDVDIKRLTATSKLIQGFAPLGSESSIARGIAEQKAEKTKGALVDTNLVIFGRGTVVSLVDASAATPTPSPHERAHHRRSHQ